MKSVLDEKSFFKSGTFWMVYDSTGFYAEYVLCPTREWARDKADDYRAKYRDALWSVIKVKVKAA